MDNINVNNSECIKEKQRFGYTEYINVCTQETTEAEWDILDKTGITIMIICIIASIIAVSKLFKE